MKENMDTICRTCLSTENELLLITSEIEDNYRVVDYFNECLNIKMNDNLPNKICLMCLDNLLEVRKFYKKCIESEKYLKTQINNKVIIKEENSNVIENIAISSANADNGYYDGGGGDDEEFIEYEILEGSMNNSSKCGVTEDKKQNKLVVGFSCVECNEDFKYEKNYRLHLKIEHNINDFLLQDELHTNNDRNVATGATDKIKTIVQKPPSSSVVKNHKCEICNYAFKFKENYRIHMERHKEEVRSDYYSITKINRESESLLCPHCGVQKESRKQLDKHIHIHLPKFTEKSKCPYCDKMVLKYGMGAHIFKHTSNRPFKCQYCGKAFRQKSVLETHLRFHTGKTIDCPLCDKKFCRTGFLKNHMRIHTGERRYTCNVCPKAYFNMTHLRAHMLSHVKERRYKCDLCAKDFKAKLSLKFHLHKHCGKPYKCPTCNFKCGQLYRFRKHLIQIHGNHEDPVKYKVISVEQFVNEHLKKSIT